VSSSEDIQQQQERLAAHRSTLDTYLHQRAFLGSGYAPPGVIHDIHEARAEIARIKAVLRGWGVEVEDHPDDAELGETGTAPVEHTPPGDQINAQRSQGFINRPTEPVRQHFGNNINIYQYQIGVLGQQETQTSIQPEMVDIEGGDFWMGSVPERDRLARDDEQPVHRVYLHPYCISRTPITNRQYAQFVQATGHQPPSHWHSDRRPPPELEEHPVVYVSWDDAKKYCEWLCNESGRPYRLPTESEWEKAARGTDGRIYPWGNDYPDERRAQFIECSGKTRPVFERIGDSNCYHLLDMAGNVWEWVEDWYGFYNQTASLDPSYLEWNPTGPSHGNRRVTRGGSWNDSSDTLRAACRRAVSPNRREPTIGFRVVYRK
jgi:formylglycine-generating enzyme required for sulfatase activity